MISVPVIQRMAVVNDIPVICAGNVQNGVMSRAGAHIFIPLEDLLDTLEGSHRIVRDGIGHTIIGSGPAAFRPHEIVLAVPLEDHGAFHIFFGSDLFIETAVLEGEQACHLVIQANDIAVPPAAVVHIDLSVGVLINKLIYRLCAIDDMADQRFAQQIFIGAFRLIRRGDTDAADLAFMDIIGRKEEIIFAVVLDHRGSPHGASCPFHFLIGEDLFMLCPVDQVFGRKAVEKSLFIERIRIGGIDPVGVAIDDRFGIRVPTGKNRIAAGGFIRGPGACRRGNDRRRAKQMLQHLFHTRKMLTEGSVSLKKIMVKKQKESFPSITVRWLSPSSRSRSRTRVWSG